MSAPISASGRRRASPLPRRRGVRFGRPEKEIPADFGEIVAAWEQKQLPISEALTRCDMSEATFYRRLREYRLLRRDTED